jgi:hypothetical protein
MNNGSILDILLSAEELLLLHDLLNMIDCGTSRDGAWPEDLNDVEVMPLKSTAQFSSILPNNCNSFQSDFGAMAEQPADGS